LIFSAIFYASNGKVKISYIDSLFNSVSAMTVTGLTTVNMSSLTPWQQTILFLQMCLGSPVSSISTLVSMVEQSTEIFQGSYFLGNGFHPQVSDRQSDLIPSASSTSTSDTFLPRNSSTFSKQRKPQVSPFNLQKITRSLGSNV
jgi:hypothetical protein